MNGRFRWTILRTGLSLGMIGSTAAAQPRRPIPNWDPTAPRGQTRQIEFTTNEGTWMSVDISPDGRWIVFDLLAQIYRVPIGGGEAQCLTQGSGIALNYHPQFSPTGDAIAFVSDRNGQDNLWLMNADGSNPRVLAGDYNSHALEPIWAADGRSVIVRRQQVEWADTPERTMIWRYPVAGGPSEELVGPNEIISWPWVARGPSSPSLSADGRSLYYQVFTGSGARKSASIDVISGSFQILRLDVATKTTTPVTVGSEGGFAPSVSPDGRWLAYAQRIPDGVLVWKGHKVTSRTALWLRNLENGTERVLMDPIEIDAAEEALKSYLVLPRYAWARDGKSIVIGQGGKLRRVWIEGGTVETIPFTARVSRTISEMGRTPARLSDGPLEVKYLRRPSASSSSTVAFQAVGRVWVQERGQPPRRLTSDRFEPFEYDPAWSPDGRWVTFVTVDRNDTRHVWRVSATGGEPERLTAAPAAYVNPAWDADGRSIVAARGAGVTARGQDLADEPWYDLVRVKASGAPSPAERLISVGSATQTAGYLPRPLPGPDGRVYYTESGFSKSERGPGRRFTVLRSIAGTGGDRRDHLRFRYASDVVPSPDLRWVAFEQNDEIYVAPFSATAVDAEPPFVDPDDPASKVTRLTHGGGLTPRWRDAETLEFGNGNRFYTHHVATGRTDTAVIKLSVPRPIPQGAIALVNARIITVDSSRRVIDRGTIVVRRGRITCVGSCPTTGVDRIVDVTGKTIMPGLIDMHAHTRSPSLDLVPPQAWHLAMFLSYGVTTMREAFGLPTHDFPAADLIEAGQVIGPRMFSAGGGVIPAPYGSNIGAATAGVGPFFEVATLEAADEQIDRLQSWGSAVLKNYYQPARDRRQALVDAARRKHLMITAENDDLYYVLGFVMDGNAGFEHSIRNLPMYSDVARFLGQARISYSSTIIAGTGSQRGKDYWVQTRDTWLDAKERLWRPWSDFIPGQRRRPMRPVTDYRHELYAQGVADVIAAGGFGSIGSHGEIGGLGAQLDLWMNASAMGPLKAIEVATKHGAYFLGLERDLGSLEPGKVADLIVLNANPLTDVRNTLDLAYVMKAGRLFNDDNLDEIWPTKRPYGPRPWVNPAMLRKDERPVDYYDRR